MKPNIEALKALLPELEQWTGGESRDLDAKIAEAFGWTDVWFNGKNALGVSPDGLDTDIPTCLGTDPSIATEAAQCLAKDLGIPWEREIQWWYEVDDKPRLVYYADCYEGHHLMLALALAIVDLNSKGK